WAGGFAGWIQWRSGGRKRNALRWADQFRRIAPFVGDTFQPLSGKGIVLAHDFALKVGARKTDLVIEPDSHAQFACIIAHAEKDLPPFLGKDRRIVSVAAVERAGRRKVE